MRVYLDWNATTPPLAEVLDAMRAAAERAWANPASVHEHGRAARGVVEDARAKVAALGGVDPRDVVLTSGGTEANNLALRSAFPALAGSPPRVLVTSRLEHPSVTRVAEALEAEGRARVVWLEVPPSGALAPEALERVLAEERGSVALVTLQVVNHETGVVQPVRELARAARVAGARVHVDAVQAWGRLEGAATDPLDPLFGGDTASLAAHKLRGPKGIGALLARPLARVSPVLLGGAQEKGVRPGTVDSVAAAGLGPPRRARCARRSAGTRCARVGMRSKRTSKTSARASSGAAPCARPTSRRRCGRGGPAPSSSPRSTSRG